MHLLSDPPKTNQNTTHLEVTRMNNLEFSNMVSARWRCIANDTIDGAALTWKQIKANILFYNFNL